MDKRNQVRYRWKINSNNRPRVWVLSAAIVNLTTAFYWVLSLSIHWENILLRVLRVIQKEFLEFEYLTQKNLTNYLILSITVQTSQGIWIQQIGTPFQHFGTRFQHFGIRLQQIVNRLRQIANGLRQIGALVQQIVIIIWIKLLKINLDVQRNDFVTMKIGSIFKHH